MFPVKESGSGPFSVLLTVPHNALEEKTSHYSHPFDYGAHPLALAIYNKFEHAKIPAALVMTSIPRSVADENRQTTQGTPFGAEVTRRLRSRGVVLHLDIHSFPPTDAKWSEYEVVQLTPYKRNPSAESLKLKDLFSRHNIKSAIIPGGDNKLINTAASYGIVTTLIEIREDVDPDKVAAVIASWTTEIWDSLTRHKDLLW